MRRSLRVIVWVAVVALPLAVVGNWVFSARNPWYSGWNPFTGPVVQYQISCDGGGLVLWRHERGSPLPPTIQREFLGISRARSGWGVAQGQLGSSVSIGFRYLTLLTFSALPLLTLLTWRVLHRRKPAPGHCPKCRYDLRATPDRCPECGFLK